jgi:hypothetical protein
MNACRRQISKISICLGLPLALFGQTLQGQQSTADEKQFADTRATAEKGDAQAQFILGYYYSVGFGVTNDEGQGGDVVSQSRRPECGRSAIRLGRML